MLFYCVFVIWLARRWTGPSYFDWTVCAYFAAVTLSLLLMPETAAAFFKHYPVTGILRLPLCRCIFFRPFLAWTRSRIITPRNPPASVLGKPIFVKINRIMTYVWAGIFRALHNC